MIITLSDSFHSKVCGSKVLFTLKKRFPLAISRGVRSDSENLFVRYDKEGITGWGEAAPGKSEGAESVIKVKQALKTDAFSTTNTTYTDITGLSITITPTAATTQMMLIPNISTYHSTGNTQLAIRLDSSNSTIHYVMGDFWSPGSGVSGNITGFYLDDHNTTNAITYKIQHKHYSGSGGINKDWSGNLNGVSTFTVIEIDSSIIS